MKLSDYIDMIQLEGQPKVELLKAISQSKGYDSNGNKLNISDLKL